MAKSRKQQYAEETRRVLVMAARRLFNKDGYAQTSLDTIAKAEGLTKGAVYHHFKNKGEIFEAVIRQVMAEAVQTVATAAQSEDAERRMIQAVDAFIDICRTDEYQRIVLRDGPAVLGLARWKALEQEYTADYVGEMVQELIRARGSEVSEVMLTRLFMAWIIEIALMVAEAEADDELYTQAKAFMLHMFAVI